MKEMDKKNKKEDMMKEKQYLILLIEKAVDAMFFQVMIDKLRNMSIIELEDLLDKIYAKQQEKEPEEVEEPEKCECEEKIAKLEKQVKKLRRNVKELKEQKKELEDLLEQSKKKSPFQGEVDKAVKASIQALKSLKKGGFDDKTANKLALTIIEHALDKKK